MDRLSLRLKGERLMKKTTQVLFFIIMILSFSAAAEVQTGEDVRDMFHELPYLGQIVHQFLNDPHISSQAKARVRDGLSTRDVEINHFPSELKEKYGFDQRLMAFYDPQNLTYTILPNDPNSSNLDDTLNLSVKKMKGSLAGQKFLKDFVIYIHDRPFGTNTYEPENPLMTLVHELGHVRMGRFLNKNLQRLVGLFPEDMLRVTGGKIEISADLEAYIQEREAYESEYLVLKNIVGNKSYLANIPKDWSGFNFKLSLAEVRPRISRQLREDYQIKDSRLIFLDSLSLGEILRHGLPKDHWKR